MAYNREDEKNQEIGDEFMNPDEDMVEAATKVQGLFRKRQSRKKKKAKKKPEPKKEVVKAYNREDEKNQEIGDEFLNPDKEMEQAATKVQGLFRKRQKRKKTKLKEEKKEVVVEKKKKKFGKARKLLCCTDGSKRSMQGFKTMFEQFYKPNDEVIVLHVYDPKKYYLLDKYKHTKIKSDYKRELMGSILSKYYKIVCVPKEDKSISDKVFEYCKECKPDYIFMGYTGRKGPKKDRTHMGSNVNKIVLRTKVPLFITKFLYERHPEDRKGFKFLLCFDGSKFGTRLYKIVKKLFDPTYDELYGTIVTGGLQRYISPEVAQKVEKRFTKFLKGNKFAGEFLPMKLVDSRGPAQIITHFVNFNEKVFIDFVLFGNSGIRGEKEGAKSIGRTAEYLMTRVKANVILVP